jgi:metal-responsive CopG/Arc/MetJ family transcriptional regulator
MAKTKVAVTLDRALIEELDALVGQRRFVNRSQAIEAAVQEQLARLKRTRLAEACAQLDPAAERALAEEGMSAELSNWPAW